MRHYYAIGRGIDTAFSARLASTGTLYRHCEARSAEAIQNLSTA